MTATLMISSGLIALCIGALVALMMRIGGLLVIIFAFLATSIALSLAGYAGAPGLLATILVLIALQAGYLCCAILRSLVRAERAHTGTPRATVVESLPDGKT